MSKSRPVKPMFSLSPVEFRQSRIAGRGVFARRRFRPGDVVVRLRPEAEDGSTCSDPEATAAAETKLTLLSEQRFVIIPDTSVPGGWLCNHSCNPNAAIFSDGAGRIQCTRDIAPGEEVTIFYGWVSHNDPSATRATAGPLGAGDSSISTSVMRTPRTSRSARAGRGDGRRDSPQTGRSTASFCSSIGQEQVQEVIATTLMRIKLRKPGSVVCAF